MLALAEKGVRRADAPAAGRCSADDASAQVKTLVLATSNRGKLVEIQRVLAGLGFDPGQPVRARRRATPIEDGHTFVENALIKARHACAVTGLPALADDSGPDRRCARRRARPDQRALRRRARRCAPATSAKLLAELRRRPGSRAHAPASIRRSCCCGMPTIRSPLIAEGVWEGRILRSAARRRRLRLRPDVLRSRARLPAPPNCRPRLKNRVSHRGQALAQLRERLRGGPRHPHDAAQPLRHMPVLIAAAPVAVHPHPLVRAQMPVLRFQFARASRGDLPVDEYVDGADRRSRAGPAAGLGPHRAQRVLRRRHAQPVSAARPSRRSCDAAARGCASRRARKSPWNAIPARSNTAASRATCAAGVNRLSLRRAEFRRRLPAAAGPHPRQRAKPSARSSWRRTPASTTSTST